MKISIDHIDFSYTPESPLILKDFSLKIKSGDIITFIGPSGAGKSTIFRLLMGFETPLKGSVILDGNVVQGKVLEDFRNRIAWLPQDLDLGEGTLEEIFFFVFNFKNNKAKKPSRSECEKVFDSLGLESLAWRSEFKSLSTGQRQRIGIALCYFLDKEILLLDEPTSALDEISKERVTKLLFHKNKIILSASHDQWWIGRSTKTVEINPVV